MAKQRCGVYERCFKCMTSSEAESLRCSIAGVGANKKEDFSKGECVAGDEEPFRSESDWGSLT